VCRLTKKARHDQFHGETPRYFRLANYQHVKLAHLLQEVHWGELEQVITLATYFLFPFDPGPSEPEEAVWTRFDESSLFNLGRVLGAREHSA
jgi:hypothetical protein